MNTSDSAINATYEELIERLKESISILEKEKKIQEEIISSQNELINMYKEMTSH